MGAVDYVKTAWTLLIPVARKSFFHALGEPRVLLRRLSELGSKVSHRTQGIEPQCIYFHRLANPRGHRAIANFCIHPGDLSSRFSRVEQPIGGIHVNAVSSSSHVPIDQGGKHLENFLNDP